MGIRRVYVEESRPVPAMLVIVSENSAESGSLVGGDTEGLPTMYRLASPRFRRGINSSSHSASRLKTD
jgi:hypothetical protein